MPDLTFLCPCKCLFGRYISEGQKVEAVCKLCGATVAQASYTLNDGQVVEVSGKFSSRPAPAFGPSHLRLPNDQYDYISPIDGSHISSKRAHRDHLKRHGCIELGNEKPDLAPKPTNIPIPKDALHSEMKNQVERMKSDGSWRER